jgi:hypothetical protein
MQQNRKIVGRNLSQKKEGRTTVRFQKKQFKEMHIFGKNKAEEN